MEPRLLLWPSAAASVPYDAPHAAVSGCRERWHVAGTLATSSHYAHQRHQPPHGALTSLVCFSGLVLLNQCWATRAILYEAAHAAVSSCREHWHLLALTGPATNHVHQGHQVSMDL